MLRETEAIVLRTFKLADADKIVVFLTKRYGLVRGVAKGARRLKSQFGASLEPFTLINLGFHEKEGRELLSIRHTEIIRSFFNLARENEAVASLEYLSELAIEFAPPHQPDERFFRMLKACLVAVEAVPNHWPALVRYFEIWSLRLSGFLADVDVCGECGKNLSSVGQDQVYATPEFILRCESCASRAGLKLNSEVYQLIRVARRETPQSWAVRFNNTQQQSQDSIAQMTRALVERHLERRPRGAV